jgi:hypothetical protein
MENTTMTTGSKVPWTFLSDDAVDSTELDCFGVHSAYARLLLSMSTTAVTPFSIALYGNWGTGKTSVVKILQSLATKEKGISSIYLDVWKYSSDPLKRWILLESTRQLAEQKAVVNYKYQNRSLQSHLEFEEQMEDETKVRLDRKVIGVLLAILASAVAAILLFVLYAPISWKSNGVIGGLIVVLGGVGFSALLFTAVFGELLKSLSGMVFRRTVRHITAKPAFSSEKFGEIFSDLVKQATEPSGRLLFIFDNLDRCSEEVAVETIGVVKTYLDEKRCVYLIPCDEEALVKHISRSYISHAEGNHEGYAREFLNKFFQVTMRLPASSDFDIEKFLDRQLEHAKMSDLPVEARDVLVLGYMGQTPRQVKRVINDLIAFRSLAVEAEQRTLLAPGSLTGDLALLTKVSVISTQWPNFLNLLSEDPELWQDMAERAEFGTSTAPMEPSLQAFLRATRHVSPNSDVRPFIFLKQFDFERDTSLAKAVEDSLRKGDSRSYEEIITREQSAAQRALVLEKTATTVRQWLQADRQIFLKNAAPLILKAALLFGDRRDLKFLALGVLENQAEKLNVDDFEKVVDTEEALSLDPDVTTPQKRKVLERFVEFFSPANDVTTARERSWGVILEHHSQFTQAQKTSIALSLNLRYGIGDGEERVLRLLGIAEKDPGGFAWLLSAQVLQQTIDHLDFSDVSIDVTRRHVLIASRKFLNSDNRRRLADRLTKLVALSDRTPDSEVTCGIRLLLDFEPEVFAPEEIRLLVMRLIDLATSSAVELKGAWLRPLFHLRSILPEDLRVAFDSLLSAEVQNPKDPDTLTELLRSLNASELKQLLSIPEVKTAMHSQPQHLETFGAASATTYRTQLVECFDVLDLVASPGLFDESRSWDLLIFVGVIKRAAETEGSGLKEAKDKLIDFSKRFLVGQLPKARTLYDSVCAATQTQRALVSVELANTVCLPTLDLFDTDLGSYYPWFQFWKGNLSVERRSELIREVSERFLHNKEIDEWIETLQLISADIVGDGELRQDQQLVKDIFDYAFGVAEEDPVAGTDVVLRLMPFLGTQHLRDYIDRGLDTLITYEASKKPLERMEPFLAMLEAPGARLTDNDLDKSARFSQRMLGPSNSEEEQNRILKLLSSVKRPELVAALRGELEGITASNSEGNAELAKALLQQVSGVQQ